MKIKVLLSAYAVRPDSGSETGVGWNYFLNLSKINSLDVFLITESEFKDEIYQACIKNKIDFGRVYFLSIGKYARKLCWNQGSWLFYLFYYSWQKDVLKKCKILNHEYKFNIVHHLNMIGYREPGLLYKLAGPKFIIGPIGGIGNANIRYLKKYYGNKIL